MAPLTPVERAKRYRERNKEKIREREGLRKNLRIVEMKVSNPERNKARLLKERFYNREYRKRMKDQPSLISDSIGEGFSPHKGPHIRGQLEKLKSHFLERGRGMLLCQVGQKSFSCVYYLNIHKVIEDDQSKILMQTKNLG